MNVIEAMKKALTGQRIKRMQRDEWMLVTDGGSELRWFNNRQRVHLTVVDIIAEDWVCEEDVVTVNRCQVEEGLNLLKVDKDINKEEIEKFFKHLGFKW
jgi:predicted nucleic acid-binding protein